MRRAVDDSSLVWCEAGRRDELASKRELTIARRLGGRRVQANQKQHQSRNQESDDSQQRGNEPGLSGFWRGGGEHRRGGCSGGQGFQRKGNITGRLEALGRIFF